MTGTDSLAAQISRARKEGQRLTARQATVAAINPNGTCDVTIGTDTEVVLGVAKLDHVICFVSDIVWCLVFPTGVVLIVGVQRARGNSLPYAIAAGAADVVLSSASTGSVGVSFPTGRFSVAPLVIATVQTSTFWTVGASGVSATGATISVRHINATLTTGNVPVHWQAIQMTNAAAQG